MDSLPFHVFVFLIYELFLFCFFNFKKVPQSVAILAGASGIAKFLDLKDHRDRMVVEVSGNFNSMKTSYE